MQTSAPFLIYGATGHTGRLLARAAKQRGLRPVLGLVVKPFDTWADRTHLAEEEKYWTANVNSTDRYTLSLPGSLRFRISPLDDTYDNFTVAGDWTHCGFNEGCVEAAVMPGRLAAHALSARGERRRA